MTRFESPSSWTPDRVRERIDKVLLTDQYIKLSEEMNAGRYEAKAKTGHQRANAWVHLAEVWAENMLNSYIEIWDLQGFPRCHALYAAIGQAIVQGFAGHNAAFEGELRQLALVRKRTVDSNTLRAFKARMNAVSGKWKRRVDVEARKAMYAARQVPEEPREGDEQRHDPPENAKIAEGGLFASWRKTRRKAELEEHLRDFASISMMSLPLDPKEREEKQKLYDAIREVALPAVAELERDRKAKLNAPINIPPMGMAHHLSPLALGSLEPIHALKSRLDDGFRHTEDYCVVEYQGKKYKLTKLAADIVRALHDAQKSNCLDCQGENFEKRLDVEGSGMRSANATEWHFLTS